MNRYAMLAAALMLVLCVGLTAALADNHAEPEPPNQEAAAAEQPPVLTPLAIGNTWVYENKADGFISTERVEGMVLFDGQPWYLVRTTEEPIDPDEDEEDLSDFVTEVWLSNKDGVEMDALVRIDEESETLELTDVIHYYRSRVAVGDVYQPFAGDPGFKIEVLSVDEVVKTKAGEFKCLVYRETHNEDPGLLITMYLAPGVGVVRYSIDQDGETVSTDLIRYTLADKP